MSEGAPVVLQKSYETAKINDNLFYDSFSDMF